MMAHVRRIEVRVQVEIHADHAAALDEACDDTASRLCVDRMTKYKQGLAVVKSMPGAVWRESSVAPLCPACKTDAKMMLHGDRWVCHGTHAIPNKGASGPGPAAGPGYAGRNGSVGDL